MSNTYEVQTVPTFSQVLPQERDAGYLSGAKGNAYALAEADAFRDLLRVALAKQVMDNTAVLAKFEEHYKALAPCGSDEYRYIVQQYARESVAMIMGGA